jgi:hypothetical protein
MAEFSELFNHVWKEFQKIVEAINRLSKDANTLVSISETDPDFTETNKILITHTKETIWKAYNNQKKLKKYYYKINHLIKPFDNLLQKVYLKSTKGIDHCNHLYSFTSEYVEKALPVFLSNVKQTGNFYKVQVGRLEWKEDETVAVTEEKSKKQPKVFFSNNIGSVVCAVGAIKPCGKQRFSCNGSLQHIKEIFEYTAQQFANFNNLSRNLLYIKLHLESFSKVLLNLKELILLKLEYYKLPNDLIKSKTSNNRLYRIACKLKKIEDILAEESTKLETFIKYLPGQLISMKSTCIPIQATVNTEKLSYNQKLLDIQSEVSYVIKFIRLLLNPSKDIQNMSPNKSYNDSKSFIFRIFHIRSMFLKKLQPYSISIQLRNNIGYLLGYLKDWKKTSGLVEDLNLFNINLSNIDLKVHSSTYQSKSEMHSYSSSWDINTDKDSNYITETDDLDSDSYEDISPIKATPFKLSQTPELPLLGISVAQSRKTLQTPDYLNASRLPNTQFNRTYTLATSFGDFRKSELNISKNLQGITNNGFIEHRIQKIQNNKSISPLTKIHYIREEFANHLKPVQIKLKNSFLKLKGKKGYLYTMR